MVMLPLPSQQYLRMMLHYDPATGALTWVRGRERGHKVVSLKVQLDGQKYATSRVIWKWMTSNDPLVLIDHEDNDNSNNKWSNLREATHAQNTFNRKKHGGTHNTLKGTWWNAYAWAAGVTINGKQTFLGNFPTEQEAHDAYVTASKKLHGSFHRSK